MFEVSAITTVGNKTKISVIFIGNKFPGIPNTAIVCCLHSIIQGNDKFQFNISENKYTLFPHLS